MARQNKGTLQERKLFDAAARLFAEKGYHGASTADLAQALGLRKSSLYHYMESKEDLLYRLLDDYMSQGLAEIEELAKLAEEPESKLRRALIYYARFYIKDPERLVLLVNESARLTGWRRREMAAKQRRYLAAFNSILGELKAAGQMRDIPETVASFSFFGMVHYTYQWFNSKGRLSAAELADLFLAIFTRGVLISPGSASHDRPA